MAMARYNPTARAASRTMPSGGSKQGATDPTRGYANQDGPGNTTNDYGPHRGGFSFAGLSSPRWDDRDPSRDYTPAMLQAEAAARQPYIDRRNELLGGDQAYQAAKASGDMRGMIAAMTALKQQGQQDRFVAQGGTPETWAGRYSNENNWPRPTSSIGYSHGPGRPDYATVGTNPSPYGPGNSAPPPSGGVRRGATPQANAPMSAGAPPMQNPMFEGYRGGGPGVPTGSGWGSAGGRQMVDTAYRPERDGGQSGLFNWLAGQGGGNPGASMGGGETGYMYDQPMGGGTNYPMQLPPQLMAQLFGGGMPRGGNMGMMGGNAYNPYAGLGMY